LGHDFLRHIQRTRLLIHLVDASSDDVVRDLEVVQQELQAYGNGLDERPCLVALNKIELLLEEELQDRLKQVSDRCGQPVLAISAATSKNLDQLLSATWKQLGI
jgi:GTP-binding protein